MSKIDFTFNWFYADNRDIGYFNSGDNPVRAPGVDPTSRPGAPAQWDWQGFDPTTQTADYTPFGEHPRRSTRTTSPPGTTSRRPVRAADDNCGYGPNYRSQSLDRASCADRRRREDEPRRADRLDGGRRQGRPARQPGAAVDARGDPHARATRSLGDEVALQAGSQRRPPPRQGPGGTYDDVPPCSSWTPGGRARVKRIFGPSSARPVRQVHGEDGPRRRAAQPRRPVGSAYIHGWYAYLRRTCAHSRPDGSGAAVAPTAAAATWELPAAARLARCATRYVTEDDLYTDSGCRAGDADVLRLGPLPRLGGVTVPAIPWINRPTWQQVVEVQGHRPR